MSEILILKLATQRLVGSIIDIIHCLLFTLQLFWLPRYVLNFISIFGNKEFMMCLVNVGYYVLRNCLRLILIFVVVRFHAWKNPVVCRWNIRQENILKEIYARLFNTSMALGAKWRKVRYLPRTIFCPYCLWNCIKIRRESLCK